MSAGRKRLLGIVVLLLLSQLLLYRWELAALGNYLVRAGQPCKADIVVVLAGDGYGHRITKAAELVKEGYAPKVLVSGPGGFYGFHEDDLAIRYMVSKGYPADWFIGFPHNATSTLAEIAVILPKLEQMGVKRFDLVTSTFHTRRSGAILARAQTKLSYCVVAAPEEFYRPDDWWHNREARKVFLLEWSKTIADWLGGG